MIDDFFQKQPPHSTGGSKTKWSYLFRCLFYTSLVGFIAGSAFGYSHMRGWITDAEEGLLLYGIAFAIGALLSTGFVLYQVHQNRIKAEKIKVRRENK